MYCQNCGKEVEQGTVYCPNCGAKVEDTHDMHEMLKPDWKFESKLRSKYYVASIIIGILSIFMSALNYFGVYFVHIIGMILGIVGLVLVNQDKKDSATYSVAAVVTSSIGLALGAIAFIYGFIVGLLSAV